MANSSISLRTASIAEICGGTLAGEGDINITGISTDTRKIRGGELFIALRGERFDANLFAAEAIEKGALAALVDTPVNLENKTYILVPDTKKALGSLAREYFSSIDALCVGVTGSVGKTSTKEFIYAVLKEKFKTAKTEGNFNNDIGLPLTLLCFEKDIEAAVIEMGMSARGEIEYLSNIARPDIAVITNIGSSHLEHLGTRENIALAKLEIVSGMSSHATLILDGDEMLLQNISASQRLIYAGFGEKCDYRAVNIRENEANIVFDVLHNGKELIKDITLCTFGVHNVKNALYAAVVGILSGIDNESIKCGLLHFSNCALRGEISEKDGVTIIEDCYNASPESMRAAIKTLSHIAKGRKIAFLGDMKELGENSSAYHREIGIFAAEKGVDILFTFGALAENIALGALAAGMARESIIIIKDTQNISFAAASLKNVLKKGDTVLFKASRAMRLETIAKEIK